MADFNYVTAIQVKRFWKIVRGMQLPTLKVLRMS